MSRSCRRKYRRPPSVVDGIDGHLHPNPLAGRGHQLGFPIQVAEVAEPEGNRLPITVRRPFHGAEIGVPMADQRARFAPEQPTGRGVGADGLHVLVDQQHRVRGLIEAEPQERPKLGELAGDQRVGRPRPRQSWSRYPPTSPRHSFGLLRHPTLTSDYTLFSSEIVSPTSERHAATDPTAERRMGRESLSSWPERLPAHRVLPPVIATAEMPARSLASVGGGGDSACGGAISANGVQVGGIRLQPDVGEGQPADGGDPDAGSQDVIAGGARALPADGDGVGRTAGDLQGRGCAGRRCRRGGRRCDARNRRQLRCRRPVRLNGVEVGVRSGGRCR